MKSVAIYCRVSTQEQAAEGYSIGEQQSRLSIFCAAHDWKVAHVYSDPGYSGAKLQRPAIQQLIRDCSYGLFDAVLVYKLDRLSRSQKDTLYLIEDIFNANHVGLVSMCENFDTQSPFGRAMIGILSVFAQLERDQITERMTMGRIGRAKAGYFAGGSRPPIGYVYAKTAGSDKQTLAIDEYEAAQVRKIFSLFLEGSTLKEICSYMHDRYTTRYGDWSHVSTVSRILRDRIYVGEVSFSGKWYRGTHEAIIDQDTFDHVQLKYDLYLGTTAGTFSQNFKGSQLLTGMIFCGRCGAHCHTKSWRNHGKHSAPDAPMKRVYRCSHGDGVRIPVQDLDRLVTAEVQKLSVDPELIRRAAAPAAASASSSEAADSIRSRLADLRRQESKLVDLYQIGGIDLQMIKSRMDDLHQEQEKLSSSLAEESPSRAALSADDAIDALASFSSVFSSGTLQEKRQILRTLIDKVVLYPDHVDIHWTFATKKEEAV